MKYNVAIIAAIMLLLTSCKEKDAEKNVSEDVQTENVEISGRECYLKVVGRDSMIFTMERTGDSIYGVFNWKPYEKDTKIQKFRGTIDSGKATTIADVSAEGMNTKEELDFDIVTDAVSVKFGEMEEGKDGIWRYKTGTPTSEELLPKVECQ